MEEERQPLWRKLPISPITISPGMIQVSTILVWILCWSKCCIFLWLNQQNVVYCGLKSTWWYFNNLYFHFFVPYSLWLNQHFSFQVSKSYVGVALKVLNFEIYHKELTEMKEHKGIKSFIFIWVALNSKLRVLIVRTLCIFFFQHYVFSLCIFTL